MRGWRRAWRPERRGLGNQEASQKEAEDEEIHGQKHPTTTATKERARRGPKEKEKGRLGAQPKKKRRESPRREFPKSEESASG